MTRWDFVGRALVCSAFRARTRTYTCQTKKHHLYKGRYPIRAPPDNFVLGC